MKLKHTLRLIAADTRERARIESRKYSWLSYLKLVLNPPALAVAIYRFQYWLNAKGWTGFAELLRYCNIVFFKTDISSKARIGQHFFLMHANGIFIGDNVTIGRDVVLVHHNTIDPRLNEYQDDSASIEIEDSVLFSCGTRIIGNVHIGHSSFIGAGAVVSEDLAECSFYFKTPGDDAAPY